MKKTIAILAIAALVYSCSGATKTEDAVDSAAVAIDSVATQSAETSGGAVKPVQNIK